MNNSISTPDPEPFSVGNYSNHNSHTGLLTSNYKSVVNCSLNSSRKPSVFNVRRRIKSLQFNNYSSVGTVLKVSVFLIGLIVAFN